MGHQLKHAISPTRSENYPEWYQQVIKSSDLAEHSVVRGCMVIKPWGYALWENIMQQLDTMFKQTGVKNAYFPLFIPLSFLQKEAEHVDGFAKECAVVTHHRLEQDETGLLKPSGPLQEPYIVRPTSETIIGESFSRWISSYRDLPILINQWANVVRWEMRTRLFLRTSEFLWQEGHTAHETESEAIERTYMMLDLYADMVEEYLAIPVIKGRKTKAERFPGAVDTLCIESLMQDRKSLQTGTSHFLGQNFAKASQIKFQSSEEKEELAWTTSWGVSTRLIGGLIMVHSDDDGLVLPPKIASAHIVLLPIIRNEDHANRVMEYTNNLAKELSNQTYNNKKIQVEIDTRQIGGKHWDWIKKGVPIRVEIGPRDIDQQAVFVARRDRSAKEKESIPKNQFVQTVASILDDIQKNLFQKALDYRNAHTCKLDDKKSFYDFFTPVDDNEIHGGYALSHWCSSEICEMNIKNDLSVTIRSIPLDAEPEIGQCIFCGKPSNYRVFFSKAY